jgi:hypothetical protein
MFRLLSVCALLALSGCDTQESSELKDFAASFRQANQASDIEPMLALYELEGSTEPTVNLLKNTLFHELGMPIKAIRFEPLSGAPEETINYTHKGIEYVATLEPILRMRVSYKTEDSFESLFTIGQNTAGKWRIASSRPIQSKREPNRKM